MMDQTHVMYYYWQQPMANTYVDLAINRLTVVLTDRNDLRMPFVTRVQAKKQALPGPMRIVPEGVSGAW